MQFQGSACHFCAKRQTNALLYPWASILPWCFHFVLAINIFFFLCERPDKRAGFFLGYFNYACLICSWHARRAWNHLFIDFGVTTKVERLLYFVSMLLFACLMRGHGLCVRFRALKSDTPHHWQKSLASLGNKVRAKLPADHAPLMLGG